MAKPIEDIEGIGGTYGEKLRAAGVTTTDELLKRGQAPAGRKEIAELTGLSTAQVLKWVNMADLFRIKGVASQYAELLEASGVDTVKELRNRVPANLLAKMLEVNKEKNLCKVPPSQKDVENWVQQASDLPPSVEY